jgi:radical SAM protein with 4Fe4S-binding SPASM domain
MKPDSCRELLQRLADQFYPDPVVRKVSFTHDGEPFVNPEFPAMLEAATELGYQIKFASNGSLVTPEIVGPLVERGVRFNICVDFCANKAEFESVRGPAGSFDRVLANLRYMAGIARDSGAVTLDIVDISGFTTNDLRQREQNLSRLKALFSDIQSERCRFFSRVFHNMAGKISVPGKADSRGKYRVCPYPWFNLNIAWDGRVVACCRDLRGETVLGNVFETDSLWDIWNGEAYQEFRAGLSAGAVKNFKACAGCDLPWDSSRWSAAYIARTVSRRLLRLGRK